MSLGNCQRCGHALAVMQEPKRVLLGGESQVVDNDGRPIAADGDGRLQRMPAFVWRVRCTRCSLEHPDHPMQKKLEEQGTAPTNPPAPPVFAPVQFSEATGMEVQDRRLTRLEAHFALLQSRVDKLAADGAECLRRLMEIEERLEAALAGERGRRKRVPASDE